MLDVATPTHPQQRIENPPRTAVRFEHSENFARVLSDLRVSLLVSTYQASNLLTIGTHQEQIKIAFHRFDQVMGIAASSNKIAVGERRAEEAFDLLYRTVVQRHVRCISDTVHGGQFVCKFHRASRRDCSDPSVKNYSVSKLQADSSHYSTTTNSF